MNQSNQLGDNERIVNPSNVLESLEMYSTNPKLIILLSGKRKSGKDHVSSLLTDYIGHHRMQHIAILRIAEPIKKEFARNNKLNFTKLLDSSDYKEDFRLAMVEWSEKYREKEGWNCFLEQAIEEQGAKDKAIWILNDARRLCDLEFFENNPLFSKVKIIKVRIEATEETRIGRGWEFVEGIDDRGTECGLDSYTTWTHVVGNDDSDRKETLYRALKPIFENVDDALRDLN